MATLLWIVCAVLVAAGLVGTVLPALPGAPLVFLGLVAGAAADDFRKVGVWPLAFCGAVAAAAIAIDVVATSVGAKRVGASPLALVGAAIGSIVGLFFGLPGLFLGPFVGALLGEWIASKDLRRAGVVGLGTWIGLALGSVAKVVLCFAMIAVFAAAWAIDTRWF